MNTINKYVNYWSSTVFWLFVLPFPFEKFSLISTGATTTNWTWLGGYHIFVTKVMSYFSFGDAATRNINTANYSYMHTWYLLILAAAALLAGCLSLLVIQKLYPTKKRKSKK